MTKYFICLLTIIASLLCSCREPQRQWHIGVSQCSEDIWRHKQNKELTIGGYVNRNVTLEFLSADDNDSLQIRQIEHFINERVDLLIVAPNQVATLSAVIDRAYDSGIPVILVDRRTNSDKYTAFMGADNYEIGHTMGYLIGEQMKGQGTLVEITGLEGSSPAIERHRGFEDAMRNYPGITVISSELGDWTEESGEKAMADVLARHKGRIDCLFGHNDRLAIGARRVAMEHGMNDIVYYGVDALPTKGGGIECVQQGIFRATYVYPTHGVELMQLAIDILEGRPYERNNRLQSSVVDENNADVLAMQYKEQERASENLETLHGKLDEYFSQVDMQKKVIVFFCIFLTVLIFLTVMLYRSWIAKSRLSERLEKRNGELQSLYKQLEDMADARLVLFTNVGHNLRTPLTLIAGPVEKLYGDSAIKGEQRRLVELMRRNLATLTELVDSILEFRKTGTIGTAVTHTAADTAAGSGTVAAITSPQRLEEAGRPVLLVVDDNADVRSLLRSFLQDTYEIMEMPDGREALKVARKMVPDLVVSDVMMPVMDGLELCRQLKADPVTCHIPVIMLTARTLEEHRAEGYASGADAYITKPFSASVLIARIENLLTSRRQLRKVFAQPGADVQDKAVATPQADSRDKSFVERIRAVIQQNMGDADFRVEQIGEGMSLSRVQLYRKVKALTGMSPVELLRKSRVERGRYLLEHTDRSISEIAYEVGFSAPSYFTKCFKDEYGKSPGEWRNV